VYGPAVNAETLVHELNERVRNMLYRTVARKQAAVQQSAVSGLAGQQQVTCEAIKISISLERHWPMHDVTFDTQAAGPCWRRR